MTAATASVAPVVPTEHAATRRTLLALLAAALGAVPLKALLTDSTWLWQGWLAMAVVIAPAALLRLRRAPSALDIWPGVILLVPLLTRLYVPQHAWGGFIPTERTFHQIGHLMDRLHRTTSEEVAPIHSTLAVRLVLCALLGLLAALVDLIAVVGRRGALAGMPLLVVYTVSGAVPRSPVSWVWFAIAAAGYLILLSLDAADEMRNWGRRVSRPGAAWSRQGLAFSGQRIGIVAIAVAVILPLLVPAHPSNLVANLFHGGSGGGSGLGNFGAGGNGGEIDPFAALKGQLERDKPVDLMTVHIEGTGTVQPFYVRTNVLDKFNGDGWSASSHGSTEPVGATGFGTAPPASAPNLTAYKATIAISGLGGNAPLLSVPRRVDGLDPGTLWSPQDQLLVGTGVHRGEVFDEEVVQPQPTQAQLEAAPSTVSRADMSRWLELPTDMPTYVTKLVARLTAGAATPYDKARAIFNYFADPANNFLYSLKTQKGDSGNDLVDFLRNKVGFCQQYAAAMGVMLRMAKVPARLVLGYMHPAPDSHGNFPITTFDAHAWVEAFFPGAGWVPFDPTPTAGLVGGKQTDLPWARHKYPNNNDIGPPKVTNAAPTSRSSTPVGAANGGGLSGSSGSPVSGSLMIALAILAGVALIALAPAGLRAGRRRRRFAAARGGDPGPLWAELSDTAVDLGYVWSPARTPRQVSAWLAHDVAQTAPALSALAAAVEQRQYAPAPAPQDTNKLTHGLRDVTDQLRSRRSARARLRALLWPASLGLGVRSVVLRRKH